MTTNSLDIDHMAARASQSAAHHMPGTGMTGLQPIQRGASSHTFRATLTGAEHHGRRLVLKVATPGIPPTGHRDVLRQAAIQRHLTGVAGIEVPAVLFTGEAESLDRPPFFAMAHVPGDCLEPIMDDVEVLPAASEIEARARHAARMLAAVHAGPVPQTPGTASVSLRDEVEKWAKSLATVGAEIQVPARRTRDALLANLPRSVPHTVIHGDFRLGNTLCTDGAVRAVIDWEIWAVSDPRIDLLWFASFTHPDRMPTALRTAPGMPDAEELLAEYRSAGGSEFTELGWFDALVRFKHAAVTALITKHNRRRPSPDPALEAAGKSVPGSLAAALALLS
ncbi:phosphotransferase family protein [Streptomyces sp. NPDC005480]|uniref:phosphotransferase family protein n=1 Tax=Streptomyces sp. NPDC005480 TaxID=3154880 RepID=UPI0033B1E242